MPRLQVGDRAPDFSAVSSEGVTLRLSDFLGRRGLVLFFYPKDGTPVCTKEACSFRDSYEPFTKAGVEVIGVSGDGPEAHQAFKTRYKLPFPLISDADGSLRKAFGVSKKLGLVPERVTFVIDQEGIVRLVFSALFASEEHVQQALAAIGAESHPR